MVLKVMHASNDSSVFMHLVFNILLYFQECVRRIREYLNTVFKVLRLSTILLYSCFDSNKSLCSTKHTQVYVKSVCRQV